MCGHGRVDRSKHAFAGAIAAVSIAVAGCTAVVATPTGTRPSPVFSPSPSSSESSTPIWCDDGPDAFTPIASCVTPTDGLLPTPTGTPTQTPAPTPTLPPGLATLPPTVPWHGKTFYSPPSGTGSRLIGLGPDDTVYVLLERPLPASKAAPTGLLGIPDVQASIIALRPDGSRKAGWPRAGVVVSGFPLSFKVGGDGTVFVATSQNPYVDYPQTFSRLTITAIGTNGKVLPGWPYTSPAAQQYLDPELLVTGPGGTVCFVNVKPGVDTSGYDVPMDIYCVGRNGKLLPGWPYASAHPLGNLAVGPDGTVYVAQRTSSEIPTVSPYAFPYQVLAIAPNGRAKQGWTPWARSDSQGIAKIVPTADGRVYMLLGGDGGKAQLVWLDRTGKAVAHHTEMASMLPWPNYKDATLASDGSLYVAVDGGTDLDFVNAYKSDGSQMSGWPQQIGGWGDIAVGPQGSVWVEWTVYGANDASLETSAVALFDRSGTLQAGYPMASLFLIEYNGDGLCVSSTGTAYATEGATAAAGSRIVSFGG